MRFFVCAMVLSVGVSTVTATTAAQSTPIAVTGALFGRVTLDSTRVGVSGAMVTIVGTSYSARTDSTGQFFLRPSPVGPQIVRVQQIGFVERRQSVTIAETGVTSFDFRLTRPMTKLDTQRVLADNWSHKPMRLANTTKYDEFYERRTMGLGGVQFTHEELVKRVNASLSEALSSVPGFRITHSGTHYDAILTSGCPQTRMTVYVDNRQVYPLGARVESPVYWPPRYGPYRGNNPGGDLPLDVLSSLDIEQVEAMEVYRSSTGMPMQARGDSCAAVFVWTR